MDLGRFYIQIINPNKEKKIAAIVSFISYKFHVV